jgi:hypothetical protein
MEQMFEISERSTDAHLTAATHSENSLVISSALAEIARRQLKSSLVGSRGPTLVQQELDFDADGSIFLELASCDT